MADGTNVVEPLDATTTTITTVDSKEIDYGGGDLRDRQRLIVAGAAPNTDVAVTTATPAAADPGLVVRQADVRSLTERMFARAPLAGYALWLDTADVTHIYLAEAPVAQDGTGTGFRGIRVTKDVNGNPLGKVQTLDGFTWDNRAAEAWA